MAVQIEEISGGRFAINLVNAWYKPELGIETFMLQFQPFEPEMRRFAHEVIRRVRRLTAVAA